MLFTRSGRAWPGGLLQTRDRTDSDARSLTQEFLSQMLGGRQTTVTLVARHLEQAGVIYHRRLEEVACECYGVVRAQLAAALPQVV
jgi:hypothetical protein